jgi:ABC-type hemin transport system ATPase subunit
VADPKELQEYRRFIEQTLVAMGRDDVGVGDVTEKSEGVLGVTLSRGSHTHTVDVPVASLQQNEQARVAITRAIFGLSKAIEKETMDIAERVAKG